MRLRPDRFVHGMPVCMVEALEARRLLSSSVVPVSVGELGAAPKTDARDVQLLQGKDGDGNYASVPTDQAVRFTLTPSLSNVELTASAVSNTSATGDLNIVVYPDTNGNSVVDQSELASPLIAPWVVVSGDPAATKPISSLPAGAYFVYLSLTNFVPPGGNGQFSARIDYSLSMSSEVVLLPDVSVSQAGVGIAAGDTTPSAGDGTQFGSAYVGAAAITRVFTVANSGAAALALGALTLSNNTDFSIVEGLSPSIAGGASDTFTVHLLTASAGSKSTRVSFATNVTGKNPFFFDVAGTVIAPNAAPSFTKGAGQAVNEDSGPRTVVGWATGISKGTPAESAQNLTFQVVADTPGLFSAGPTIAADGTLSFTPAPNASGEASVTVTLKDDGGTAGGGVDTSAQQTFTISIAAVNDAPSFNLIASPDQSVLEDSGQRTAVGFASGMLAGPADEGGQLLTFVLTPDNAALFAFAPAINSAGTLSFTPAPDANGVANVSVVLHDSGGTGNGGVDVSVQRTFTISVGAVNDPPTFVLGPNQAAFEDSGLHTVNGFASAIAPGPANEAGQSVAFQVANDNPALFAVAPAIAPDGVLTYTLAANQTGLAGVSIVLKDNGGTADGGNDTSTTLNFTIGVGALNQAPSFVIGTVDPRLEGSGAAQVNGFAHDISPGPANEVGQAVGFIVSNNNNALFAIQPTIAPDGTLTFTPAANASGQALVTVQAQDDGGTANGGADTSVSQTFTITVNAVNDAPSLDPIGNQTVEQDATTTNVNLTGISAGPANESSQTLAITASSSNPGLIANPTITYTQGQSDGVLSFTPVAGQSGTATITVSVLDDGGNASGGVNTVTREFTITVNPLVPLVPPKAIISALAQPIRRGLSYSFTVLYSGDINATTIDDRDVYVTGPHRFGQWAKRVSVKPASTAGQIVATYRIAAPGGRWDNADRGNYTFRLYPNRVSDTRGAAVPAVQRTFAVRLPSAVAALLR